MTSYRKLSSMWDKRWVWMIGGVLLAAMAQAQELNCKVVIDYQNVQISDQTIFAEMEQDFTKFLNERNWTDDEFQENERIKCNILVTLSSMPSIGVYEATVQIISARPVYGSEYETVLFNFADRDWNFSYNPTRPIQYNENSFTDNVSSLLAYYAYLIIGLDYDSFSPSGGESYLQKAFDIVNNAQQSSFPGWQQLGSNRNRYWLIENLRNASLAPIRTANYEYHRQGMDLMHENPDQARTNILGALEKIQLANRARPRSILTISFLDAKASELANLFSEGNNAQRRKAYNLLISLDPSKSETFKPMIE